MMSISAAAMSIMIMWFVRMYQPFSDWMIGTSITCSSGLAASIRLGRSELIIVFLFRRVVRLCGTGPEDACEADRLGGEQREVEGDDQEHGRRLRVAAESHGEHRRAQRDDRPRAGG